MNRCGIAVLQVGLLLVCVSAYAAVKNALIRITVVDSETRSVAPSDNGVPNDCDQVTFDAYCRSGRSVLLKNTLLVQEGNQPAFRVTCTSESRFSRCMPLPKGQSFDAKKEKRGLMVYYADDKGKLRQQLYTYVGGEPAGAAVVTTTSSTAPTNSASANAAPVTTAAPAAAQPVPALVPAGAPPVSAPAAAAQPTPAAQNATATQGTVKCSFSSTPPGAEVTVDGRYVGSTPSVLSLSTGNHTVEVSLPGFAQWKRELTVSPGSELTVNAVLEKAQ